MLYHMFLRHNMTYALVEDVLKLLNRVFGSHVLETSEYIFRKLFESKCTMHIHFYCPSCEMYLGENSTFTDTSTITCDCGNICQVKNLQEDNYFATISIADSLRYLLEKTDVKLLLPRERNDGVLEDVMDGALYQEKILPKFKSGENVLTLTFNTDGAKVFKTPKKSMWPIQFIVNEIPLEERFKAENVFLAGLWYGQGSPNMTTFMTPFSDELQSLAANGVELMTSSQEKILYHVYALIASVDSGAKPKLLRQKAHNGKCACPVCLHPNLPVPGFPQNMLRFVEKDEEGNVLCFADRTHESVVKDMLKADELDRQSKLKKPNDHVNGMLGIGCVAGIPEFDLVRSFAFDYLHTGLLGNFASEIKYLFDTRELRTESHDPSAEIPVIEKRLSNVKPPNSMAARSRSFGERDSWKGKELRLFALIYVLPCLEGLQKISRRHFEHLRKFVISLQILLGSKITEEQLVYVERLLKEYVLEFQELFGAIHMTLNVHLLKHVVKMVRDLGPLGPVSNFCFESGNGRLANLVQGTQGVVSQICQTYLGILTVSDFLKDHKVSDNVLKFCNAVMKYPHLKKSVKIDEGTRTLGVETMVELQSEEIAAALASGISELLENVSADFLSYNRVLLKGTVYYCKSYTKPERFDDTCIKLVDGSYAIAEKFVKTPGNSTLFVIIRPIQLSQVDEKLAPLISTGAFHFLGDLKVIKINEVVSKCACLRLDNANFVCELPNHFERD